MSTRPTRTRLFERRRHAANFACIFAFACRFAFNGWTQGAFSRHLGIPQATAALREKVEGREEKGELLERDSSPFSTGYSRGSAWTPSLALRVGVVHRREQIIAHSDDFVAHSSGVVAHRGDIGAPKGPLCATREFHAEFDASQNRIEACDNFRGIFRSRYLLFKASFRATQVLERQEETARGTGDRRARAARKFMHKSAMKEC